MITTMAASAGPTRRRETEISRADVSSLLLSEEVPLWGILLSDQWPNHSLIDALDAAVDRLLEKASGGSIGSGWLTNLARLLRAEILFVDEPQWRGYDPTEAFRHKAGQRWQRGLIRRKE